LQTKLDKHDW